MESEILIVTLLGILIVTLIDSLGSIASRRFRFNYGWFIILSVLTYSLIPYYLSQKTSFEVALLSNCIIGFYDATIGFKISEVLKAYNGTNTEDIRKYASLVHRLLIMFFLALILTYFGFTIGSK